MLESRQLAERDLQEIDTTEAIIQDRLTLGTLINNHQFGEESTTRPNKSGPKSLRKVSVRR